MCRWRPLKKGNNILASLFLSRCFWATSGHFWTKGCMRVFLLFVLIHNCRKCNKIVLHWIFHFLQSGYRIKKKKQIRITNLVSFLHKRRLPFAQSLQHQSSSLAVIHSCEHIWQMGTSATGTPASAWFFFFFSLLYLFPEKKAGFRKWGSLSIISVVRLCCFSSCLCYLCHCQRFQWTLKGCGYCLQLSVCLRHSSMWHDLVLFACCMENENTKKNGCLLIYLT